jgi:uncharacterized protein YqeY
MATPKEQLEAAVKDAMKARDTEKLATLRLLLTSVKNEAIQTGEEIDESLFLVLVRRQIKQRRDAAEQYRKGERLELAEKEEREIGFLEVYLPAQASEDDVRAAMSEFITQQGLEGMKGMGPVMQAMKERFGDTADGATLSRLAKELLAG